MPTLSIIVIIAAILIVSYKGFKDTYFFQKYMFYQGAILNHREYYRLFTSGFLHVNWPHLIFNLITLLFFFKYPLNYLGEFSFILLYVLSLLASSLFSLLVNRKNMSYTAVGASGAVSAIVFSAICIDPNLKLLILPIPVPIPGWIFAIAYLAISYYGMRKSIGNIGHSAHLGGAAFGVLFTLLLRPSLFMHNKLLIGAVISVIVIIISWEFYRNRK